MTRRIALYAILTLLIGLAATPLGFAQAPAPMPTPDQNVGSPANTTPASPADTTGVQPTGKIAQIKLIGNKNISTDTVLAVVSEKPGDEFDAAAAERDRVAVSAMGYWTGPAQFAATPDMKGGLDLTFSMTENPVVQAIAFNANT